MPRFRRFSVLLIALAALVAIPTIAACGGDDSTKSPTVVASAAAAGGSPTPVKASLKVQLNFVENAEHYGIAYADKTGFYKAQNLNVEVIPGGQGIDGLQMVAAGAADIAVSSPSTVMTALSQGIPVIAFAAEFDKTPSAMICRKDKGVSTIADGW